MTNAVQDRTHNTVHTVVVAAPAEVVYDLVADAEQWPHVFEPTVHTIRVPAGENEERLRLWAFANGEVRTWGSARTLDPQRLRIRFQQLVSSPPVEYMGGEWVLEPLSPVSTRVTLLHDFRTIDDNAEHTRWILSATDRNSNSELAALKRTAELGDRFAELVLSFSDSVLVHAPLPAVYGYLYRADLWPRLLPHVSRLDLREPSPGLQSMEMDTVGKDGSVHTTKSVRVCFPDEAIVYKQTSRPEIMAAHTGRWSFQEHGDAVEVTSQHTVVIRPESIATVLGPGATVGQARDALQQALSTNSTTTLRFAKEAAESAR